MPAIAFTLEEVKRTVVLTTVQNLHESPHFLATAVATAVIYLAVLYRRQRSGVLLQGYAAAAVLTVAIIPFTLMVMDSTNEALFVLEEAHSKGKEIRGGRSGDGRELLARWGYLHLCRSVLPGIGAVVGFRTLAQELTGERTQVVSDKVK